MRKDCKSIRFIILYGTTKKSLWKVLGRDTKENRTKNRGDSTMRLGVSILKS